MKALKVQMLLLELFPVEMGAERGKNKQEKRTAARTACVAGHILSHLGFLDPSEVCPLPLKSLLRSQMCQPLVVCAGFSGDRLPKSSLCVIPADASLSKVPLVGAQQPRQLPRALQEPQAQEAADAVAIEQQRA